MRVSYSISFDTFESLQPPFRAISPAGRGLYFFYQWALAITGIGFVLIVVRIAFLLGQTEWPSASLTKGVAVFLFGGLPSLGVWIARKLSERHTRNEHEDFLRESYGRLHCRGERFMEIARDGLVFGCACKSALAPWATLTTLVETPATFVVGSHSEAQVIPKAAFQSEADRTEFRNVLSERICHDQSPGARTVEIACNPADWRNASWLQFKMGDGCDSHC